jgi:catechol 2,3-dioxygenase-like lactoylglutathione lyase family enzyme
MGLLYASIRARNIKRSVDFYTKKLGMKVTGKRTPIPGEIVYTLTSPETGQRLTIMWYGKNCRLYKPYEKGDEMDHLMFGVKDAKKTFTTLVKSGAPVAMDLFEGTAGFTMGFVKDPDGIWVGLRSGGDK